MADNEMAAAEAAAEGAAFAWLFEAGGPFDHLLSLSDAAAVAVTALAIACIAWIGRTVLLGYIHRAFESKHGRAAPRSLRHVNKPAAEEFLCVLITKLLSPTIMLLFSLYCASVAADIPALSSVAYFATVAIVIKEGIVTSEVIASYFIRSYTARHNAGDHANNAAENIIKILRWVLYLAGVVVLMDMVGINVQPFITAFGIGGVAVALAAQTVLTDLFASFSILIDKPFNTGDFVSMDGVSGTVEHIGFKTTRIRALTGELLVLTNSAMSNAKITNFTQRKYEMKLIPLDLVYDTPPSRLRALPSIIEAAVAKVSLATCLDVYVKQLAGSGVLCEARVKVETLDASVSREIVNNLLITILEELEREKIQLAYPTTRVVLSRDASMLPSGGSLT